MQKNNNEALCLPGTMIDKGQLADGTRRLIINVQEVSPESLFSIIQKSGKLGWFFFHESPIQEIDTAKLPEIVLEEGEKSPSVRLRAILFCFWEQNKIQVPFDTFYKQRINQWIDAVKEKLS